MRLVQFHIPSEGRRVAIADSGTLRLLAQTESLYRLALDAIETGRSLDELAGERARGETASYDEIESKGWLLPPLDHPPGQRRRPRQDAPDRYRDQGREPDGLHEDFSMGA
jgi:hypothetical protein